MLGLITRNLATPSLFRNGILESRPGDAFGAIESTMRWAFSMAPGSMSATRIIRRTLSVVWGSTRIGDCGLAFQGMRARRSISRRPAGFVTGLAVVFEWHQ